MCRRRVPSPRWPVGAVAEALATPHLLFEAIRAELVVDLALLVVGQDLVRLGDLLELLLGGLRVVLVQVRMVLLREPPVRSLDLVLGRPARDAEPLVVVIVGHLALFPRDGPRSLLVHVLEVRVHDARVGRATGIAGTRRWGFRRPALPVHLDPDLLRRLVQRADRGSELRDIIRREDFPKGFELLLDGLAGRLRNGGAVLLEVRLRRVDELVRGVPQLEALAPTPG